MVRPVLLAALLLVGCKSDTGPAADKAAKPLADASCAKAKPHGPLAWFEDDYASALACAKSRNVPLVLDLWAPWCHTCLSMQTTVFTDASFAPLADKFVFAALDTDRPQNAEVVEKFPLSAWPTFYVIDAEQNVLARFVGAASLAQFHAFLDMGANASAGVAGAAKHLLAAERALAAKDLATADRELTAALATAPADWVRKPDVLVSLMQTKQKRDDTAGCLALLAASIDDTGNAASATDFIGVALPCVETQAKTNPGEGHALRERMITRLQKVLADPASSQSIDDRSDGMIYLRELLISVDRKDEATALAEQQRQLLEKAAATAPTPVAAMTYNWHLAEVFVFLGRPLEAVPALEKSAAALPDEYDPPARLGWLYLKAGKLDEAATWTERALALVYGPRKARLLGQRAEIAGKQGDTAGERRYRAEAVALWESLPPGQANPAALAAAKAALAAISPTGDEPPAVPDASP
ncbi:MAG: thioredoxin family protein [Kofleriaceae bacterium]|nr:thioredoxin family protein [Kofleriaceae bacterium]